VGARQLARGYRCLIERRVRGETLRQAAARYRTTAVTVLAWEHQFLRHTPAAWKAIFPNSKLNAMRDRLWPRAEELSARRTDPLHHQSVTRLLTFGMAPNRVAVHVGWQLANVQAEAATL